MVKVIVECPATNRAIFTGLRLEGEEFPALLNIPRQVQCPYCGGSHVWYKHDAILFDDADINEHDSLGTIEKSKKSVLKP